MCFHYHETKQRSRASFLNDVRSSFHEAVATPGVGDRHFIPSSLEYNCISIELEFR